jgi:hypothetical protein
LAISEYHENYQSEINSGLNCFKAIDRFCFTSASIENDGAGQSPAPLISCLEHVCKISF